MLHNTLPLVQVACPLRSDVGARERRKLSGGKTRGNKWLQPGRCVCMYMCTQCTQHHPTIKSYHPKFTFDGNHTIKSLYNHTIKSHFLRHMNYKTIHSHVIISHHITSHRNIPHQIISHQIISHHIRSYLSNMIKI